MSYLFLHLSVNEIIYWTFNIWLKIFMLSTRHRHDGSFRQLVVPGNPLVFHFISDGPSLVALLKLLEGCDRGLLSHESRQTLKILVRPTNRGYCITWIPWSSSHCVVAAALWGGPIDVLYILRVSPRLFVLIMLKFCILQNTKKKMKI